MAKAQASVLWAWTKSVQFVKAAGRRYSHLPIFGKLFVWAFALFVIAVATFILVIGPSTVAQKMYDIAQVLARRPFGWLILATVMVIASFPPLVGYSTCVTLCGFAYGVKGFFIAGPSAVAGSAIVFITLRLAFRKRIRKWALHNEKWQALEAVIGEKGLPLMILIRVCPLPPWVYSNALFASIEAVALWQFIIATLFTLPKIFLTVFIGSRIARLADGKEREEMDSTTILLNLFSIILGIALSVIAGVVLYRLMQKQIKALRESPLVQDELAAEALEEAEEATPLLNNLSSDSIHVIGE